MKKVTIVCKCGASFARPLKEHTRSTKLGRVEYCSRACAARSLNNFGDKRNTNTEHLKGYKRVADPFNCYIRAVHRRRHLRNFSIGIPVTRKYLRELWDAQDGKCAYSGIPLEHPTWKNRDMLEHKKASLDRIDSNKPYEQGNVQFISVLLNYAKSTLTDGEFRVALKELGFNFQK